MTNISIASYSFNGLRKEGKIDLFGYLESCKYRYGLQTADIWNGMLLSTEEDYLRKVKEALEEKELKLVNLCVDWADLWHDDREQREELRRNALAHLRAAEYLGARTMRLDFGVRDQTDLTEEQFDCIVSGYKEYSEFAYNAGFKVGPENHYGAQLYPDVMQRVSEAVDHPAYGILLHFNRWRSDIENGDRRVAKYIMHTHLDANNMMNRVEECLSILRDAEYKGCLGLEYNAPGDQYAEVEWLLSSVKRALKAK